MRSTTMGAARALGLLAGFLVVSLVAGGLAAGLFIPAVGATGSLTRSSVDFFTSLQKDLDAPPLSEQSVLYANDKKTVLARFYEENRVIVPLTRISQPMQNAIIAIEDSRFYQHGGIDPKGLLRALLSNAASDGGSTQGASTLTQQYVKNVLLEAALLKGDDQGAEEAVIRSGREGQARKLREIGLAIQLEKKMKKPEILEGYLNIANFGDARYGVEAASQYYFSTRASKLTLTQSALLAGLVQLPGAYNPFKYAKKAKARRDVVLTRMRDLGYITRAEHRKAVKAPLGLKKRDISRGCITAADNMAYFCSYVKRMIEIDSRFKALGKNEAERRNALNRGGLAIYSTIDPKLQKLATAAINKRMPIGATNDGAMSAAVTVEPGTGKVVAMAQSKNYSPEKGTGKTEINFNVDYQYGGSIGAEVGSTFKPFTLATWLKSGKGLNDVVDSNQNVKRFGQFQRCDGKRLKDTQEYRYFNSEGGKQGQVSVIEATYRSINTAYVEIESQVELCDLARTAMDLGAHRAAPRDLNEICGEGKKITTEIPDCTPSLTLGTVNMSPLTMASAYATFSAEGTYCPPNPILGIKDRNNKPVRFAVPECKQGALDPDIARGVVYTTKNVWKGTAAALGEPSYPAAGKTGTTNNSVDTWFVGFTKQLATAVWTGDPNIYRTGDRGRCADGLKSCRRSMNGTTIKGKRYGKVFGGTISAPIWRDFMDAAMKGQARQDWAPPPAKMIQGSSVGVPDVRGRSLQDAFSALSGAGFQPQIGTPRASEYPAGSVADTSPGPGSPATPGGTVFVYLSTGGGFTTQETANRGNTGNERGDRRRDPRRPRDPRDNGRPDRPVVPPDPRR